MYFIFFSNLPVNFFSFIRMTIQNNQLYYNNHAIVYMFNNLCSCASIYLLPAQQRPVITTLTKLFNETSEALGGSRANPAKKREIEDNSKKFGSLFEKLNSGDISKNAGEKLVQLCQALDRGDFSSALQIQVSYVLEI